jgi:hypothetical protein
MRKVLVRIGGVVAASATLLLASVSLAVASPAAKPVTGPEAITGAVYGMAAIANVTHIPLTLAGVVATTDRGFTLGTGGGNTHTLATPVGELTVSGVSKQSTTQTLNTRTCYFSYTVRQQMEFVPRQRYSSGTHRGERDTGNRDTGNNVQPLANGAVATFLATGVLTVG